MEQDDKVSINPIHPYIPFPSQSSQLLKVFWKRMTRWASTQIIYPSQSSQLLKVFWNRMNKVSFNDHLITLLNCEIESKIGCVKTCLMNFIFRTKMVISTGLSSYPDKSSDRSWQNVSSGSQKLQIRSSGAFDVSCYLTIPHNFNSFKTILMEKSSSKWTWKKNFLWMCEKGNVNCE